MESVKSYLLRAFIAWCKDNNLTPVMVINTHGSLLPDFLYDYPQVNLHVSSAACLYFRVEKNIVSLTARFNGEPFDVQIPLQNCLVMFTKEQDCFLDLELIEEGFPEKPLPTARKTTKASPAKMKVIWDARKKTL